MNPHSQASLSEIIFLIEESIEGGYVARAIGQSIVTQAQTMPELHQNIRDAVRCHFDEGKGPILIRLPFVREELIAA